MANPFTIQFTEYLILCLNMSSVVYSISDILYNIKYLKYSIRCFIYCKNILYNIIDILNS